MVPFVVDHTKLTRRHALYGLFGMHDVAAGARLLEHGGMIFGRVAYLECYALHVHRHGEKVEVVDRKILTVGRARLEAVAHIQYVALHVLLHGIPRATAETEAVALTDGVEP